jgi:hypothetical protein
MSTEPRYRTSSYSLNNGTCVEVAFRASSGCGNGACVEVGHDGGQVLVRDSKNPDSPVLRFTADEWTAFLAGAAAGEFNPPD